MLMTEASEAMPTVADLLARARVYVEGSHAKQTLEAYAADWKHFTTWCDQHKRRSLPAAPETIICYLVETADAYRVATLDRRLASISYYHKQARHTLPTKDPEVERTMRGIRRAKGMAPHGKAPLLPAQLRQAIDALPDTLIGTREHALLVIGFAGAFRRSELVALTMEDVQTTREGLMRLRLGAKRHRHLASIQNRSRRADHGAWPGQGNERRNLPGAGLREVGERSEDHHRADLPSGQPLLHGWHEGAQRPGGPADREGGLDAGRD
jgi:site-specific recombinase XerD